jgi:hypothetical protein
MIINLGVLVGLIAAYDVLANRGMLPSIVGPWADRRPDSCEE